MLGLSGHVLDCWTGSFGALLQEWFQKFEWLLELFLKVLIVSGVWQQSSESSDLQSSFVFLG